MWQLLFRLRPPSDLFRYDVVVAVGGGSSMDTAKACALLAGNEDSELMDFATRPYGRQLLPKKAALPVIAVPTTAGGAHQFY